MSVDDLRELRHSSVMGLPTLFLEASLRELNEKHHKALQTKALLQSTTKKETPKKAVTRPKPSYDNSQQNCCVPQPACVLSSVASVVVSENAQGSPGDPLPSSGCPSSGRFTFSAFLAPARPPTPALPSIPQPLAFSGESLDDFTTKRALIDA